MNITIAWDSHVQAAPSPFQTAVNSAVAYLDSIFQDNITVRIGVDWGYVNGMAVTALGESLTNYQTYSAATVRAALFADATTTSDSQANAALANPAYTVAVTDANARALGLLPAATAGAIDGYVGFSSSSTWDFDRTNGISAGAYDFYGVVLHEITEVLGRMSFVDDPSLISLQDFFRFSGLGAHVYDTSATAYFSIDNGATNLGNWDTSGNGDYGDWAASVGADMARASSTAGVLNPFTTRDILNLDVIGYNYVAPVATAPEIAVSWSGTDIVDGDTTPSGIEGTDFGSVGLGGSAVQRTFTVANIGTATLTLGSINLPSGFSLVEGLSTSIAAGGSDTFTIQLNTAAVGSYSGQISFITNDSNENPFNFSIAGTVSLFTEGVDVVTLTQPGGTWHALGGNDIVNGSSGVDIIYGDADDDTIDGKGGADQLFGGDGNDTIYGDLTDTTINGGAGNDTLYLPTGSAFRGYAMSANSIEMIVTSENGNQVNVVSNADGTIDEATYDTAGTQTYSFYANHYTSNWLLNLQQFIDDNGNQRNLGYDITNVQSYTYYQNTYNSAGQLLTQQIQDDNGNQRVVGYDAANVASFTSYVNTYNPAGQLTLQQIQDDNGNNRVLGYDVDNQYPWSYYQNTYNSAGTLVDSRTFP